jgi:hypothetical protein
MRRNAINVSMFLLMGLLLVNGQTALAQTTPFLSDAEIRMLVNEISGDRAFEHIRWLTHWHRDSGMEGFSRRRIMFQAAKMLACRTCVF